MTTAILPKVQANMGQFCGRISAQVLLSVPQRELSYQAFDEEQELKNSIGFVWDEAKIQSPLSFPRTELSEPCRDCEDMHDEAGYLEESWRMFIRILDSHVPMIRLRMNVIRDFVHRWSTELLYEQIVRAIRAKNNRRFRKIVL